MAFWRKLASIYAGIGRTYLTGAPALLLLATAVFLPIGLLDALSAEVQVDSLNVTNGLKIAAMIGTTAAVTVTGLLGEVFYSGTVAVSLTHPEHEKPPPISEVARRLDYRRLILVDIAYVAIVIVGLLLLIVPGILVFIWFGLSGPVVEIERRTVRGALARSFSLVRGNFWTVFLVLTPVELAGDAVTELVSGGVHDLLGHSIFATWLAESLSNIAFTPLFAVAAVLLTLDLISERDGSGPNLSPAPRAVTA